MNAHIKGNQFVEDKQEILNKMLDMLQCTSNLGDDRYNSLSELRFIPQGTKDNASLSRMVHNGVLIDDIVRPIFKDGTGENGYYDVCVGMDSGFGVIVDVMKQFVFQI